MKIGIIGFVDKNKLPYLKFYEEIIQQEGIKYEAVFWDRFNNLKTEKIGNEYTIHIKCIPGENKIKKILPMFRFKLEVEKIIRKEQYTHLIILTTLPGVLLNKTLLNNFKNKYIFDIRDYTYEKYNFYKKVVDKLIDNSFFTSISSKGFLRFLNDNDKIVLCHNISNIEGNKENCEDLKNKKQITIGFIGGVRYFKENCKLIDTFANNSNYRLIYIGKTNIDCNLEEYCKSKNVTNVYFKGEFKNEDKPKLYEDIDLINALYGNDSLEVTTALPNRLYDGILFKKPIIATNGTYLGEIVENYNIGISIDLDANILNKIVLFLNSFKIEQFVNSTNTLLDIVNKEQENYINNIRKFTKNILYN